MCPRTSATALYVTFPWQTFKPAKKFWSLFKDFLYPSFANYIKKGSVALFKASVEVLGTPPGMFATQ